MDNQPITGAQWEYLTALGEDADEKTTKAEASARIGSAKQQYHKPPTRRQVHLAREWSLILAADATRREATDTPYRFVTARRWVYSVARKMIEAEHEWRKYEDSCLPEQKINAVAHAVLDDQMLAQAAESATRGSSFTGAAWNRYTTKAVQAAPFQRTAAMIQEQMGSVLHRAAKQNKSGCLAVLVVFGGVLLTACWLLH